MTALTSADQALIRELNLSLVLRYIHNKAPASRAQIAHVTGLNKSTVSSLVDELLQRQLIHETGTNSVGTGRPATLLEINPRVGGIIGAEFGVDFIAMALTDFRGNILWRQMTTVDPGDAQEAIISRALELTSTAVEVCKTNDLCCLGIGLSVPGTVDLERGVLIFAPNLGWRSVPLKKIFTEHTGSKVYMENDANAAAMAEHLFGAARNCDDFIFVVVGIGVGGGLFLNGNLYRGKDGLAGEIGHTPIVGEPYQMRCHCGKLGCWETYANQHSLVRRIQAYQETDPESLIPGGLEQQNTPLSIATIKQAADGGDRYVLSALSETGAAIGHGFASLFDIFNPEKIILGGPISTVGNYLLPSLKQTATNHLLSDSSLSVDIRLSSFGTDAILLGAISIVVDDILAHPTLVERR